MHTSFALDFKFFSFDFFRLSRPFPMPILRLNERRTVGYRSRQRISRRKPRSPIGFVMRILNAATPSYDIRKKPKYKEIPRFTMNITKYINQFKQKISYARQADAVKDITHGNAKFKLLVKSTTYDPRGSGQRGVPKCHLETL